MNFFNKNNKNCHLQNGCYTFNNYNNNCKELIIKFPHFIGRAFNVPMDKPGK